MEDIIFVKLNNLDARRTQPEMFIVEGSGYIDAYYYLAPSGGLGNGPIRAEPDPRLQVGVHGQGDEGHLRCEEKQAQNRVVGPLELLICKLVREESCNPFSIN